jgi:hypothetical protein
VLNLYMTVVPPHLLWLDIWAVAAVVAALLCAVGRRTYIGPRCAICGRPVPTATSSAMLDMLGMPPSRTICMWCLTKIRLDSPGGPDAG